jgi:hypothetical protein
MRESIAIDTADTAVFDFIGDGNNDPLWRAEVDRMDVQGERELGTLMIEYSSFFRFLHTVTPTRSSSSRRQRGRARDAGTNPTWLRSIRTVERISDTSSRFKLRLAPHEAAAFARGGGISDERCRLGRRAGVPVRRSPLPQ